VDRVLKYERLNEDLGEVFAKLGIPFSGSLKVKAKSEYRSDRTHYRNVFSEAQKNRIEREFEREIALHNYEF
jgi:ribosomal 30S subunit maturation factor RimM